MNAYRIACLAVVAAVVSLNVMIARGADLAGDTFDAATIPCGSFVNNDATVWATDDLHLEAQARAGRPKAAADAPEIQEGVS